MRHIWADLVEYWANGSKFIGPSTDHDCDCSGFCALWAAGYGCIQHADAAFFEFRSHFSGHVRVTACLIDDNLSGSKAFDQPRPAEDDLAHVLRPRYADHDQVT